MKNEELFMMNRFTEDLKEYQKTTGEIVNEVGLAGFMKVFLKQEHTRQSGACCLQFLVSTYTEGLKETLEEVNKIGCDDAVKDILELISTAREKYDLTEKEVDLFLQFFGNHTLIAVTEENAMWEDVSNDLLLSLDVRKEIKQVFQSKRCGRIFKEILHSGDIRYKALDTRAYSDNGGFTWYTNRDSSSYIELPYMPTEPEYIYLDREGNPTEDKDLIDMMCEEAEENYVEELKMREAIKNKVDSILTNMDISNVFDSVGVVLASIDKDGNISIADEDTAKDFAEQVLSDFKGEDK